jgi:DNA-binding NarL/FixJ family response regulator
VAERLGPSSLLARAQARVSEAYMLTDDATAAIEWADRAIAMAEQTGPRSVLLAALVNKGTAMVEPNGPPSRARRREGLALLERVAAEAAASDHDLTLHRTLWNLMVNQVQSWPLERSWQVYRQLRAASERAGHAANNIGLAIRRAEIHLVEGDLHAAIAAIAEGRRLTRTRNPSSVFEFLLDPYEAELRIEAGELAAAEELLARSREALLSASQECDRVWYWTLHVSLAARRGDLDAVRAAAAQADAQVAAWWWGLGPAPSIGLIDALRAGLPPAEVRAMLAKADQLTGVAACSPQDRAWVEDLPLRTHLNAALLEAEGDLEAATGAYRRAAGVEDYRTPQLLADCHLGAARCLLALGRQAEARDHARQADRLLERWPGWRRDQTRALLRRLGATDGQPVAGPDVLTAREREVAALLVEGLSNGEVARRLFISTKTASVHVSNILAKLGMTSRAEVAAWAARNGLGPAPEPATADR